MFSSNTSQVSGGGYQISRSLRFNSADSTYLTRTPGSSSNRKTWTWSGWAKRSTLSTDQTLFEVFNGNNDNQTFNIAWFSTNCISIGAYNVFWLQTTPLYRDPSAWYHIVCAVDTTQATANNRIRLYVNGSEVTAFSTRNNPTQNDDLAINQAAAHYIGTRNAGSLWLNGYLTEVNFIDGQQLTPSSFGETNAQTGVWQPKAYSGSYGTNGFYLNFSDNSNTTAATLGKDYSGNGNNWTPNNFSVTAGAGNDSLVDSPTAYGTDTGAGGTVRGNYCTWNPLAANSSAIITNGNLDVATTISDVGQARGTIGVSSGKWYWEVTRTTSGANLIAGIVDSATGADKYPGQTSGSYGYYGLDGTKVNNGSFSAYGASFGIGDVIGVALDLDAGTLVFYKNGTSQGTAFTGLSGTFFPAASDDTGGGSMNYVGNFGQRPFAYTAPSGFKALCTQNLPTPTIGATTATQAGKYFNPVLYTGNASTNNITGVGFQPDFVWIKQRDVLRSHGLYDAVRGALKDLQSDRTDAEVNYSGSLTSFNSDGFSLGSATDPNASGGSFVAWNWKANGSGSSNTAGYITSTVSANTTSGFSVVTYTGNGTGTAANGTVGHGLGVVPSMIIIKRRDNTGFWWVATRDGGTSTSPTYSWFTRGSSGLNNTGAAFGTGQTFASSGYITSTTFNVYWLNAAVSAGDSYDINYNTGTYVAYCFAAVPGYSAFGSYTGNGSSDGPFVFTGFRPAFVMIKSTAGVENWVMKDRLRAAAYNPQNGNLYPNLSNAEDTISTVDIDFLSNGFKLRGTYSGTNSNGVTYIYAAFAESPFKYSLAR